MTRKQKINILQSIVAECYCELETFCENVLASDGKIVFTVKLDNCKNRQDIENLVNEYI